MFRKEFKESILKSQFHITRFLGLLIMPFLYAFTFTWAFFDPFSKTENIPMQVVTMKGGDPFTNALADEMANGPSYIKTGEMKLKLNMKHIYIKNKSELDGVAKDGYSTFFLPSITPIKKPHNATAPVSKKPTFLQGLQGIIQNVISKNKSATSNPLLKVMELIKQYTVKDANGKNIKQIKTFANYKINYLLGFGADTASDMSGKYSLIAKKVLQTISKLSDDVIKGTGSTWFKNDVLNDIPKILNTANKNNIIKMFNKINGSKSAANAQLPQQVNSEMIATVAKYKLDDILHSKILDLEAVKITTQMGGDKAKYGLGLGVFFISVGMWIGAIVMTFAVHSKIHDKTVHPIKRYLVKFSIIAIGIILQATILMTSLYFIGFDKIGIDHWFLLYISVIFSSLVFASITQMIRFITPNRVMGIFFTIILLVFQIASSGGLFPWQGQSWFFRAIHHILPMSYALDLFRETLYDTDVSKVMFNVGYLLMFTVSIPIGAAVKNYQDSIYYKKQGWTMPSYYGGENV